MDWILILSRLAALAVIALFLARFAPDQFDRDAALRRSSAMASKQPAALLEVVARGPMIGTLHDHPLYSHLLADVAFGSTVLRMTLAYDGIISSEAERQRTMTAMGSDECVVFDG